MIKWQYYRIKSKAVPTEGNTSIIDILSDELGCNQEDIEWLYEKEDD